MGWANARSRNWGGADQQGRDTVEIPERYGLGWGWPRRGDRRRDRLSAPGVNLRDQRSAECGVGAVVVIGARDKVHSRMLTAAEVREMLPDRQLVERRLHPPRDGPRAPCRAGDRQRPPGAWCDHHQGAPSAASSSKPAPCRLVTRARQHQGGERCCASAEPEAFAVCRRQGVAFRRPKCRHSLFTGPAPHCRGRRSARPEFGIGAKTRRRLPRSRCGAAGTVDLTQQALRSAKRMADLFAAPRQAELRGRPLRTDVRRTLAARSPSPFAAVRVLRRCRSRQVDQGIDPRTRQCSPHAARQRDRSRVWRHDRLDARSAARDAPIAALPGLIWRRFQRQGLESVPAAVRMEAD